MKSVSEDEAWQKHARGEGPECLCGKGKPWAIRSYPFENAASRSWGKSAQVTGFRFERFVFTAEVMDDLYLPPFKGGSLRGALGELIRQVVCVKKRGVCSDCGEASCVYRTLFEATDEKGRPVAAPYVLEPPADDRSLIPCGEELSFGLILVGRALTLLPFLIMVFDEIGKKGIGRFRSRYRLMRVSADGQEVYSDGRLVALPQGKSLEDVWAGSPYDDGAIRIDFLTPVHLREEGRLADPARFPVLFDSVYRRAKLLARFHSDERLREDPALREAAAKVKLLGSDTKLYRRALSRTREILEADGTSAGWHLPVWLPRCAGFKVGILRRSRLHLRLAGTGSLRCHQW